MKIFRASHTPYLEEANILHSLVQPLSTGSLTGGIGLSDSPTSNMVKIRGGQDGPLQGSWAFKSGQSQTCAGNCAGLRFRIALSLIFCTPVENKVCITSEMYITTEWAVLYNIHSPITPLHVTALTNLDGPGCNKLLNYLCSVQKHQETRGIETNSHNSNHNAIEISDNKSTLSLYLKEQFI